MNYIIRISLFISCIILFTGCTKTTSKMVEDQQVQIDIGEKDSTEKKVVLPSSSQEYKEEVVDSKLVRIKNGLVDPTLTVVGQDTDDFGELSINVKSQDNMVLMCKDPVYNIFYYVNCGGDYYIYRIKDGVKEAVVEMPAKRLFARDGKLYFMLETYEIYQLDELVNGNIFSYDPLTGEVKLVVDMPADSMIVYEDGIHINQYKRKQIDGVETDLLDKESFIYSFDSQELSKYDYPFDIMKWNDYHIERELNEENWSLSVGYLTKWDQSERIPLNQLLPWSYAIEDNKLYMSMDKDTFKVIDLNTKESEEYKLVKPCESGDFTKMGNKIYFANFVVLDLESKTQSYIFKDDLKLPEGMDIAAYYQLNINFSSYNEIYTDGEKLFVYGSTRMGEKSLYEVSLITMDQGPITTTDENGQELELGDLYHLEPFWESSKEK